MGRTILIVLIINLLIGGVATDYFAEYWLSHFKGEVVEIPFWKSAVAGLFLGEFTIPFAVLTLIFGPLITS